MHTYLGLFENGAFRPRIHRNGHTYPHVSGAFWKRSGPKTKLFENAPESGSFENGGFGSGSFLRVNLVSGSFLPLFPRRSETACPSDEYCFTCICSSVQFRNVCLRIPTAQSNGREGPKRSKSSLVAETGRSSQFLFVSKGVAFENKTEDGCCCLQKQHYLVAFLDEGGVFCFCFILLRLLFVFHFAFGLEPFFYHLPPWFANYVHSFRGAQAREAIQKYDTGKQRKQTKKVRFELQSCPYTEAPWFSGGGTFPRINPRPCERGLRIDVRYVWTPQNGSFRKPIFLKTYTCARSLKRWRFFWTENLQIREKKVGFLLQDRTEIGTANRACKSSLQTVLYTLTTASNFKVSRDTFHFPWKRKSSFFSL